MYVGGGGGGGVHVCVHACMHVCMYACVACMHAICDWLQGQGLYTHNQ